MVCQRFGGWCVNVSVDGVVSTYKLSNGLVTCWGWDRGGETVVDHHREQETHAMEIGYLDRRQDCGCVVRRTPAVL